MSADLVSVVMPAYNCERFIDEAIASVHEQTHANWQLLVVDDCSRDGTREVARSWATRDARIALVALTENGGSSYARNAGLRQCSGRYVAFLDADDAWHPDKLVRQLRFMDVQAASFSFTAYRKVGPAGPGGVIRALDSVSWRDMLKGNRIGCSTVVLDASTLPEIRFPTSLGRQEDYALWLALLRGGMRARGLDEPLCRYRVHPGSKSARKLASVSAQWQVYRDFEKLSYPHAAWYLAHYAVRGLAKAMQ